MADYEIRLNNTVTRSVCPSCGEEFKPAWGAWPFAPGSWDPLCERCADGRDLTSAEDRESNSGHPFGDWPRHA